MTSITFLKKTIHNPLANEKNDFWVKDEKRFGVKMLMSMGWTPGKGLGLNEDGCPDAIKVRLKNDVKGVGYKERDDQWITHQDDFNALLCNLNGGRTFSDQECKPQNLEAKSKNSRSRIHYHKMARYKDLSCRSEQDLAIILGKRSRNVEEPDRMESTEVTSSSSSFDMRQYFLMKKIEIENCNEAIQWPEIVPESPPKKPKSKKMKVKKVTFGDVKVTIKNGPCLLEKTPWENRIQSNGDNNQSEITLKRSKRKKHHKSEDVGDIGLTTNYESVQDPLLNDMKNANLRPTSGDDDSIAPVKKKKKKKYKSDCLEGKVHYASGRKSKKRKSKKKSSTRSMKSSKMSTAEQDPDVSITGLVESLKTINMFEVAQNNMFHNGFS